MIDLCRKLQAKYKIDRRNVMGHVEGIIVSDKYQGGYPAGHYPHYTKGGKDCPGETFQWEILEQAQVAVGPRQRPISPFLEDPPALNGRTNATLETPAKGSTPEQVLQVKQWLYDIGYSVSSQKVARSQLTGTLDRALSMAVRAFQLHYFSGRFRRFLLFHPQPPRKAELTNPAVYGHIDSLTVDRIAEVWARTGRRKISGDL